MSGAEKAEALRAFVGANKTASEIGEELGGVSRSSIISAARRYKVPCLMQRTKATDHAMRRDGRLRHKPEPKPAAPKLTAEEARARREPKDVPANTWAPLPDSTPVALEDRTGCAWPVEVGDRRLFCNGAVSTGSYCTHHDHLAFYRSP